MSFFINDTIANQVERGEWFYSFSDKFAGSSVLDATTNAVKYSIINTTNPTMFMLQVGSPEPVQVGLWTTDSLNEGTGVTLRNMNFTQSDTTNVSLTLSPTGVTPAVGKAFQVIYPNSTNRGTVANSLETPFILNTTDEYYLTIANISPINQQVVNISFFFRELP